MPGKPTVYRPPHARTPQQVEQAVDERRGSAASRGYGWRWQKASAAFLRRHPLCVGCLARGRTQAATVTDHIIPARDRPDLFWREDNWQAACRRCHDSIKPRLEALWRSGEIAAAALRLDSVVALKIACDSA